MSHPLFPSYWVDRSLKAILPFLPRTPPPGPAAHTSCSAAAYYTVEAPRVAAAILSRGLFAM
jgi:hypothetical protein